MKGKLLHAMLILAILLGAGVTWAVAQNETETYYACVNNSSGAMKIVSASANCHKNEYKIEWNNVGPTGAQGPQGPEGPQGAQGPVGPATATLAFNPFPTFSDVTLMNITINGGDVTGPVLAGTNVQVELDYSIVQPDWCPACVQQIVFGISSQDKPSVCVFTGFGPAAGHASFTLTVPAAPGTEYIALERAMMYSCEQALGWQWPTPTLHQYIGVIAIH